MEKKKILIFIDWFLPGYNAGGQIPSVANIIKYNKDLYDFHVITSDTDLGAKSSYPDIESDKWIKKYGATIYYADLETLSAKKMKSLIHFVSPDLVYFNSLFSIKFTLIPLVISKYHLKIKEIVLAPRGMLGTGALQLKAFKKRSFISLTKSLGLFNDVIWHASSEIEKKEIESNFKELKEVRVALDIPNVPSELNLLQKIEKEKDSLKVFFISRISPKKNLLFAIKILSKIKPLYDITFTIIGPVEDKLYWKSCELEISKLPKNIKVEYLGVLESHKINQYLTFNQHVFLFPTFSENFGHVIAESMFSGCPVILSDNTPWRNLENSNAGWDFSLNEEGKFVEKIEYFASITQEDFNIFAKGAFAFGKEFCLNPSVLGANRMLFE
ncbi:glycosyltransferase family 4 protein [Formosa undariae]|uniref:Glycosyltransferase family 4 protein n=1 Tax=Formosa undariae TaxID=1325436 RepID=A0ABV5F4Z8_9FLAO